MRSLPRLLTSGVAVAALGLAGCSAEIVPGGPDANAASTRALLVVEQKAAADSVEAAKSHASVWFLRVSDEQSVDAVTRLVTDVLEVPADGQCTKPADARALRIDPNAAPVELSLAGDVAVETEGSRVQLAVRSFPDVANIVSGVMYTAPGLPDLLLPDNGLVVLRASGTEGFAPMDAQAHAPTPPEAVRVNGLALGAEELEVPAGTPVVLSWTPGSSGDRIYVDVDPLPGSASDRTRCSLPDTGTGQVSFTVGTPSAQVSVHRLRVSPLQSASGSVGTAHFDVAVTGKVRVASP